MTNLFVRSGISFVDRSEVLTHIGVMTPTY